jgi:2-oxoglutarate ferredoxin oxidoreductase subunit gamma
MAGVGGRGVMLISKLMAEAAFSKYKNVTWSPSYFTTMRGGSAQGTIIFSNEDIASPIIDKADVVVIVDSSQLKDFVSRVKPGGTIIMESSSVEDKVDRKDINVIDIPATKIAQEVGSLQAANLILLGAYIQLIKDVPIEHVEQVLQKKFAGKEQSLSLNINALREGAKLIQERNSSTKKQV